MSSKENSFDSSKTHYNRPPVPSYLNRVKALSLSTFDQAVPPKILSTFIFNESPRERESSAISPVPINTVSVTPIRSRKIQTKLSFKKKAPLKRRSSSVKPEFNVKNVPKLNEEVKKILKIVCEHSRCCQDIYLKILKGGGSKLLKAYLKSTTSI